MDTQLIKSTIQEKLSVSLLRKIMFLAIGILSYEAVRYVVGSSYMAIKESYFGSDNDIKPLTVEAEAVRKGSIIHAITIPGRLVANQKVTLRPEVEGKIKEIFFDGGQEVQKGDPLYQIEDSVFKAQLKEAQAKLVLAKQELERASRLAAQNAGTMKQKEKAHADLLEAEANVEIHQHRAENALIKAPFEGYVGINNISVGSYVNQQTELATIVDSDPMRIDFKIPARYMKQISKGQHIKLLVDGAGTEEIDARISNIDVRVEENIHSAAVRATVNNQKNMLKAGVFANVKVTVGSKDNTLLVPKDAIKSSSDEEYVFRVVKANSNQNKPLLLAYKTPVVTGLHSGETIEILNGLKENEQIVVIGLDKIRHGFPIEVLGGETKINLDALSEDDSEDDEDDDEED